MAGINAQILTSAGLSGIIALLELDEEKVSRPVLRGLGDGNSPRLPGDNPQIDQRQL